MEHVSITSTAPFADDKLYSVGKGSAVAKKEILLSAGVFNTPQLLQLSGIGDNGLLSKLHIPTLVNLPSVGLNFSDHPLLQHDYIVNTNLTIPAFVSSDVIDENIQTWNTTHQGPLTDTIVNTLGFLRFPPNSSIFKTFKDPSPGPTAGHWELIIGVRVLLFDNRHCLMSCCLSRMANSTLERLLLILPYLTGTIWRSTRRSWLRHLVRSPYGIAIILV